MKKLKINMLSYADTIKGQGVGTAYLEMLNLLKEKASKELDIVINNGLKCDVMHLHTPDPISYTKQRLSRGKSLTHVHFMSDTLEGAVKLPKILMKGYSWFVKKCYMKSDYLVVVNPISIEKLSKIGYPKERIFYIPNFVSNKKFYPMKDKDILKYRKKYGYEKEDFITIGVGQLHTGKGILDFVECAKNNPDIKFIWVGGFPFGRFMDGYDEIKKYYDNPPKNLRFTDIVPHKEVNILCNISDVFLFPSYVENFPLVVIEAANTNKPLILRDIEEYKHIYFNKYLKGNSIEDFNRELRLIKEDKKTYNKYKKYSKELAKFYSEENICKMWIELYRKISK